MKILYVILTCEKYLNTRVKWQRETWVKGVDFVYLDKFYLDNDFEEYNTTPKKYIQFFNEFKRLDAYDWFFFCDDDTFVYTEKLYKLLSNWGNNGWDNEKPLMIGFRGGTFAIHNLDITWCSGGAGIAMSRELVKAIQEHLRATPNPLVTHETDISLAIWATMAAKDLIVIDNKRFSPFNPYESIQNGMKDCITYHYCTENDFIRLGREL